MAKKYFITPKDAPGTKKKSKGRQKASMLEGESYLKQALLDNPNRIASNTLMGQFKLMFSGKPAEAIPYLAKCVQLNQEDHSCWEHLSQAYRLSKRPALAKRCKTRAAWVKALHKAHKPREADKQEGQGQQRQAARPPGAQSDLAAMRQRFLKESNGGKGEEDGEEDEHENDEL